jgi:signal transduction histidine kinase
MNKTQGMSATIEQNWESSSPVWLRRPAPLHRTSLILVFAAAIAEIVRLVAGQGPYVVLFAVALGLVGAVAERWLPWVGLILASIAPLVAGLFGWGPVIEWTIAVFVLFSFALRGRSAFWGALTVAVFSYSGGVIADHSLIGVDALAAVVPAIAGAAVGTALRIHQQYWHSLEQRAADAVATREIEATRRVVEERLRIARDLHDVVGHQVAVLGVQLGAIEVSTSPQTAATKKAFAATRESVKSILLETQQILSVLRDDRKPGESGLDPTPGIANLETLIESFRQIGLDVAETLISTPIGIDPAVDVTVYRVVQEALTNAHRYGDGRATVAVGLRGGRVTVDVSNPLGLDVSVERAESGFGLIGMQERVTSAGGTLQFGPAGGGVFSVKVVLDASGRAV